MAHIKMEKVDFQDTDIKSIFIKYLRMSNMLSEKEAELIYEYTITGSAAIIGVDIAFQLMLSFSKRIAFNYIDFVKEVSEHQKDEDIIKYSGLTEDDITNLQDYI